MVRKIGPRVAHAPAPTTPASPLAKTTKAVKLDALEASPPPQLIGEKAEKKALAALGLTPLLAKVDGMSEKAIAAAIEAQEKLHPLPTAKTMAKRLAPLHTGDLVEIPLHAIHPGQVQLSLANVREKMGDFVERVDERRHHPEVKSKCLLDYSEALTAVIGPGARSIILTDGHHHIAALKATQEVVGKIVGGGIAHGGRPSKTEPGKELAFVDALFGGKKGEPTVPLRIVGDYRDTPPDQFWALLASGKAADGKKLAHLTTRDGTARAAAPARFSDLEDNPFRFLASQITGKVELTESGKLNVRGADPPVWLKVLGSAPDFIEFSIARVVEAAFAQAKKKYVPGEKLSAEERTVARAALIHAQHDPSHPEHATLQGIVVTTRDRSLSKLAKDLDVKDGAIRIPKKLGTPSKRRLQRIEKAYAALTHA